MSELRATLIDVGWGETILLEYVTRNDRRFALVDCKKDAGSSERFIQRHLATHGVDLAARQTLFDFVILTHAHSDHYSGILPMLKRYGAAHFWYSKGSPLVAGVNRIISYCNNAANVAQHQAIDSSKTLPNFGSVKMKVLWPPPSPSGQPYDAHNPNNNSVVLLLTHRDACFVLTADCEARNWPGFVRKLPQKSKMKLFKVPHHGADNGMFTTTRETPWVRHVGKRTRIALSTHVERHGHPAPTVIQGLEDEGFRFVFRTDEHYHLTFTTTGGDIRTKYSHY